MDTVQLAQKHDREQISSDIDAPMLSAEERADLAVERFTRDKLTAAANEDANKEVEMNGDAGDF